RRGTIALAIPVVSPAHNGPVAASRDGVIFAAIATPTRCDLDVGDAAGKRGHVGHTMIVVAPGHDRPVAAPRDRESIARRDPDVAQPCQGRGHVDLALAVEAIR